MYYLPRKWAEALAWYKNFLAGITGAAVLLNESATDVAAIRADVQELLDAEEAAVLAEQVWKSAQAKLAAVKSRTGLNVRRLITRIKANPLYNEEIGGILRIVNTINTTDKTAIAPELKVKVSGGYVQIRFTKNGMHGVNIYSELPGETGFSLLGAALKSGYTDPRPPAVPGVPELRKYRAMYIDNNHETGQWSEIIIVSYSG